MGNSESREKSFERLSVRSQTFDSRRSVRLANQWEFRPLTKRSVTFDSRRAVTSAVTSCSYSDVLYRRHFNAQPKRLATTTTTTITPTITKTSDKVQRQQAVVVVDPFSTGIQLAEQILAFPETNFELICVWSDTLEVMQPLIAHTPKSLRAKFRIEVYHDNREQQQLYPQTLNQLQDLHLNIVAVVAGAETGVMLADRLSEDLGVLTNGVSGSKARRNKYLMGEKIGATGLRSVNQCAATKWSQVEEFLAANPQLLQQKVIVKPVESAGSDDVTLCQSLEEIQQAFGTIQGKINGLGLINQSTLIQEYLEGTEYVVDSVSYKGNHKIVAVWEYDKRPVNGSAFVYFGVLLAEIHNNPKLQQIIQYILKVLDALEIQNGPAHAEVKYLEKEMQPCLVEIGSRFLGGQGTYIPIVNEAIGYSQVTATLDAYLRPEYFEATYPSQPHPLKKFGGEATLVSYESGRIAEYCGLKNVQDTCPSYVSHFLHAEIGSELCPTIDLFTSPASIMLLHDSQQIFQEDYLKIHDMCKTSMYRFDKEKPKEEQKEPKIVVIVDPFSTGAYVAKKLMDRNYIVICLYSDLLANLDQVTSLVPPNMELSFAATLHYSNSPDLLADTVQNAANQVAQDRNVCPQIVAVMPGAETGVHVADLLTAALLSRSNSLLNQGNCMDDNLTLCRRNKYLMGERLRQCSLNHIRQVNATSVAEIATFLSDVLKIKNINSDSFEVVLKPVQSAGTDDVTLCCDWHSVVETFNRIYLKTNGLGLLNESVLVQDYICGTEYVIDTVTCQKKHFVTCVWKYDKRQVNNQAFVYFGLEIMDTQSCDPILQQIIQYQFQVLDALGFENGPAHGELKYIEATKAPVLIEVGARCHGGEGNWIDLVDKCIGYNQVDLSLDAYLNPSHFLKTYPQQPGKLLAYGCEAMLVSYEEGILASFPGLSEIQNCESFLKSEIFIQPGEKLKRTVDMFTTPGSILLLHKDKQVLKRNLELIRTLEKKGLFLLSN